jgi:hypothetical protein
MKKLFGKVISSTKYFYHVKYYSSPFIYQLPTGLIMMDITGEDDFVSRAAGEWRNSSERVITIIRE